MLYVFGDCVLDTQLYVLHRGGQPVRLRPKAFQMLVYLLAQRERVVTKQELSEQVWPRQFISDATLESTIAAVRRALGDSRPGQRYLLTLRGYGYRFIAPVEERLGVLPNAAGQSGLPGMDASTALARDDWQTAVVVTSPAHVEEQAADTLLTSSETPPLPLEHLSDAGERKLVTVLCCALHPTPGLRAQGNLDTLHQQLHVLYDLVEHEARRYGGTVQPVVGERVLVVFGLPVAQEDHAQRAVLAALDLQQRLQQAPAAGGGAPTPQPSVRISVHTGPVAAGGLSRDAAAAIGVVGETVTHAVAIQTAATPGVILCSEATARLVQEVVRLTATTPTVWPGLETPLYQILSRRSQHTPPGWRAGRLLSPFVGRQRELMTLQAVLAQAETGQGQVVGIVGEPGLGKSRLLSEFCHSLQGRQLTYLATSCLSYTQAIPYLPMRRLLRYHCGITQDDPPATIIAKVHQGLEAVGVAPDEAAPYLLRLLEMPVEPELTATRSPQAIKSRTIAVLVQLALSGARRRPLVLEVENLHWIDPSSEEVLTALVERLAGTTILLVVTYRPGYRLLWLGKSYVTQVALSPLALADSQQVVQANLRTTQVAATLVQTILAKAQGNPFFLEELARAVVEENAGQEPIAMVPETVQGVLAARIDRLPPPAKRLLQVAAVIGKNVPLPLLQAVASLPEEALHQQLTRLQAGEFLYEILLESAPAYTFKHTLTQEVAYSSLLQERRRVLHARILEAIEDLYPNWLTEQVERLAYHALRGAVWEKALAYCRQVGEKALARSAYREAVGYFEQALSVLPHLPETRDTREQAIDLRVALRSALFQLGEFERIFTLLREAETLATTLGDQRRLAQVSAFLSANLDMRGDLDRALETSQRAVTIATALGDVRLQVSANFHLGVAYYSLGDYRRAIVCLRRNVEVLEGELPRGHMGGPGVRSVASRTWLVWSLAELGAFAEGIMRGEEGVQIAEAGDEPLHLINADAGLGILYLCKGDLHRAIPMLERGLERCQRWPLPLFLPLVAAALGSAYALCGHFAEALRLLEQTVEQATASNRIARLPGWMAQWGEACLLAGRINEAAQLAGRALELACTHNGRGRQAWILRLLGDIAAHRLLPDITPAVAYYRQALALAEELGMRPLQAHCHLGLGALYAKVGLSEPARAALSTAIELYRIMDMTFWLPQAEAAMASLRGGMGE